MQCYAFLMIREELAGKHAAAIRRFVQVHGLRLVVLYGSAARGTETSASDIDIAVLGRSPLSHESEAVLAEELARATGMPRIEMKSLHRVSPLFLETVLRDGIVLYESKPGLVRALSLYAWKLSKESAHLREARYRKVRERIEKAHAG